MMNPLFRKGGWFLTLIFITLAMAKAAVIPIQPTPVPLPNASDGIGFDDLGYDAQLDKVLVPAGRTGNLDLIDSKTLNITSITGFSSGNGFNGGHDEGITSVDSGNGYLFTTDRSAKQIDVVDPTTEGIVGVAAVQGNPDYVRYVKSSHELWITEPDNEQLEVFVLPKEDSPIPVYSMTISITGGPESLIIDEGRGRAYTHLWEGKTIAIDLKTHSVVDQWDNGCEGSRGIALDATNGFLFVGCSEGKAVVLDINHDGQQLSSLKLGSGVDIISYSPHLRHLYVPSSDSAKMGILDVSSDGKLSLLGLADTTDGAHCVVADNRGNAWVCDPTKGQLLLIKDPFVTTPDATATPS